MTSNETTSSLSKDSKQEEAAKYYEIKKVIGKNWMRETNKVIYKL
jgi:hypothetical protein